MSSKLVIFILFSVLILRINAQQDSSKYVVKTDTALIAKKTNNIKRNNPKVATLLSIVPGAGQFYNKQYWKIPIFYGLLGYQAYNFGVKNKKFKKYLYALNAKQRNDEDYYFSSDIKDLTVDQLQQYKDKYRRSRDLSAVLFIAIWGFNLIDANVYANLYDFDVSDDLTIKVKPNIIPIYTLKQDNAYVLSIQFNF